MMHAQIEDQEIIERYARNQLSPEERQAFEEHFFACDECFEKLQAAERFIAGLRDAARRGALDSDLAGAVPARRWAAWTLPTLAAGACAAVVLAVVAGGMFFFQVPRLRQQLQRTEAELQSEREARAALEQQIARGNQAEVNVPLVMLQATRDVQAPPNEAALPPGTQRLVLWVELPVGTSGTYRLQVNTANNEPVKTLENLKRNAYGALAASLPAAALQPGDYRITVSRQEPLPATLVGEYRLRIRRP